MKIIKLEEELNKVILKKNEIVETKENEYIKLNNLQQEKMETINKRDHMHSLLFDRVLIILTFLMTTGVNIVLGTNTINIIVGVVMDLFLGISFIKNIKDVDKLEDNKDHECSTFEIRCNEKLAKLDKEIELIKNNVVNYNDSIKKIDNIIKEIEYEINSINDIKENINNEINDYNIKNNDELVYVKTK